MPTIDLVQTLSEKEKAIYDMLCANMCNDEIAEALHLCTRGVVWNLTKIYKKLGVSSTSKADLHLCRQRAISYGGTKIEQIIRPEIKTGEYSREDILTASKKLSWYDASRVTEMITDLLKVLDEPMKTRY